jgi:hypothetical protein
MDGYADAVIALADLCGRAGATALQIGWDCPHTPDAGDGHNCADVTWHAHASYRGARLMSDGRHRTPTGAAMALAERLLTGATCRCRATVALADGADGCRWRLVGQRWQPSCRARSVRIREGDRGDREAMLSAVHGNRATRRAARKRRAD